MFTGIIEHLGTINKIVENEEGRRFYVDVDASFGAVNLGDSIALMGCCLTQASEFYGELVFDVIPETIRKTALGTYSVGDQVHLEKAMTGETLISGHFVQGHIDWIGEVSHIQEGEDWRLSIRLPKAAIPLFIPKGSVTLNGVSLTIAEIDKTGMMTVALIPTTLEKTCLGQLKIADQVNLESDMIVRSVVHAIENMSDIGMIQAKGVR